MKRIQSIPLSTYFLLSSLSLSAAVPLRWTVETSRLQPAVFDVVRGETLSLEAEFQSYGKPVATSNMTAFLCWQTNGMASAWWVTNAVTTATVARVLFTPEMDPGATVVHAFLGLSDSTNSNNQTLKNSNNYRAAVTLRFRQGPGAVPNAIEGPVKVLDLAHTVVINPPWPTQADFAATTTVMKAELKGYVDEQITGAGLVSPTMTTNIAGNVVSNVVTKSYVKDLGIVGGVDTNAVSGIITNHVDSGYLCTVTAAQAMTNDESIVRQLSEQIIGTKKYSIYAARSEVAEHALGSDSAMRANKIYSIADLISLEYDYTIGKWISKPDVGDTVPLAYESNTLSGYGITNAYTKAEADAAFAPTSTAVAVSQQSQQISTLNSGYTRLYNFVTGATNANFSATNYPPTAADSATRCHYQPEPGMDFSTVPASLQLNEYRDGAWRTVMDTRDWTVWYYRFKETQLTNEIAMLKAENAVISNSLETAKAWANHTANGVENPMTDTLVVDRPNMWLMADYEWQKCVSGSNQCFVIRAKNVALSGGANTNGFLEICDAFGKPYMRVNKSAETFADCVFSNSTYNAEEGAWYIVYGNSTKPTKGGANCELVGTSSGGGRCLLYDEDDPDCPATITWPESAESHAGHWIMKAVPKPVGGVVPSKMFFGAEIKVAGKDYVEYIKEASFGAGIRVGNNVYEAVESGNTLIWQKKVD